MIPVESPFQPGLIVIVTGVTPRYNEFWDSLDALHVPDGTCKIRRGGPDCDTNRNEAIRAMPAEAQWALFLDDDQVFAPDTLMKMLYTLHGTLGIDALTGLYCKKVPSFEPILYKHTTGGQFTLERLTYPELQGPLMRVYACGGGMLLVKRATLETIGDPWFNPGPGRQYGGDLGFGGAMLQKGLALYADLTLGIGHTMPATLTPVFDGEWFIEIKLGGVPFRIPVSQFAPKAHTV